MANYFNDRGNFWYSSKYRTLMNCFIKMAKMDHVLDDNLIESVPHLLVIAAIIGHSKGLKEDVEKDRNDVFIGGFASTFHDQRLDFWVAMIVWLDEGGDEETELFKPEFDVEVCNKFNQLAMGGLGYLYKKQFNDETSDTTGLSLIQEELRKAFLVFKAKQN